MIGVIGKPYVAIQIGSVQEITEKLVCDEQGMWWMNIYSSDIGIEKVC